MMHAPSPAPSHLFQGGRLVAVDGRTLPLVATAIAGNASGGIARVVVEQRFRNTHDVPLAVTYSLPLPPDAAVSGYAFRVGDRRIVGEIDKRAAARERFEDAVLEGKAAALLEQERSSLFTQEIANVPPGGEVMTEVTLDQRLRFLQEGEWEWRFPRTVAPRYLGEPGRVADGPRVTQRVANVPLPVRTALDFVVRDELVTGRVPESPSDRIRVEGASMSPVRQLRPLMRTTRSRCLPSCRRAPMRARRPSRATSSSCWTRAARCPANRSTRRAASSAR